MIHIALKYYFYNRIIFVILKAYGQKVRVFNIKGGWDEKFRSDDIDSDKKENLQSNICISIEGSFCVLFFVLVVLLLNLKLLKTWKSKTAALDGSNILASVIAEDLAQFK